MNNLVESIKRVFQNKNTVTIIGVIVILVLLYIGYSTQINRAVNPVSVPVATQTIQPRTEITSDMVKQVDMPNISVEENVVRTKAAVVGKYSNINSVIPAGSMFYKEMLITKDDLPDAAFIKLKSGEVPYNFRVNMLSKKREIELNIRKDKLITTGESNTYRNMTNNYDDITFIDNKLNIIGTSYNYGISYKQDNFVERKLILENTTTFKQYTYDVGATKDGSYEVKVSDNIDKTFAWYNSSIDVSNLEKGTYSIIVYTKTKDVSDYGEVVNIFGTVNEATTEINNKKYKVQINLKRNKRIELVVE